MASAAKKPKLHSKSFPVTCFDESAAFEPIPAQAGRPMPVGLASRRLTT